MDLKPGDVVILKSGGHPVTVAEVNDEAIVCLWMGGEGDLFRETLPWPSSKSATCRRFGMMRTKRTRRR